MDRRDVATWVSGPRAALDAAGIDIGYRGERIGLPEDGLGSIAGTGRRLGALFIDWLASALVAHLLLPQFVYGSEQSGFATLGVFFVMKSALTILGGASFGQRLLGIRVISLNKGYVNVWRSLSRTFLICLLVPAVIWDRDGRGLQDRLTNTVVVRAR